MGFFDFLSKWFCSKQKNNEQPKPQHKQNKKEDIKKKTEKYYEDDKSFHPEILFLINKPYAEYVDFIEVK